MESETTLTSTADDGLYEILLHAARASADATQGAVGLLELTLEKSAERPTVTVEAQFAYQDGRRVIDELAVRVRKDIERASDTAPMLREGLARFGGTDFTNLNVCSASGEDTFDASVSFGSLLPLLAKNILLPIETDSTDELAFYSSLLDDLGVSHRVSGGTLRAAHRQLRSKMTVEQQLNAYSHARGKDRTVSLYACVLPAKQAVRFSQSGREQTAGAAWIDVVLSRGLSGGSVCSSEDARRMQAFVERHLGVVFSGGVWSVRNVFGQGPKHDTEPVFGGSRRGRGLGFKKR